MLGLPFPTLTLQTRYLLASIEGSDYGEQCPPKRSPSLTVSLWFHRLANPGVFLRFTRPCLPIIGGLGAVILLVGLVWGLFFSPADWQQGETVRIMYLHVPMAWLASACYVGLALCGACSLIWRHPLADLAALEIGPIGACAALLCLISGSFWGKPTWGTWWVWDARLTSMLVLFFLYCGHMAVIRAFDRPARGQKAAALLALAGVIDLPIITFSVQWWNTLHQPNTLSLSGAPAMSLSMLWPLLLCAIGYSLGAVALIGTRICTAILERRLASLPHRQGQP
ncbi:heme ABC transporter permease CcmC [Saccharibacter floricola]|uniref:heme ABC transporter permease CcmC n=1 Tax=Saccharibacter floricola TaxID=231053 RepID=UPI00035DD45E